MFGLSVSHLVVLGIVILLFGSRRLPELGSAIGKSIFAFKKGLDGNFESAQKKLSEPPEFSGSDESDDKTQSNV